MALLAAVVLTPVVIVVLHLVAMVDLLPLAKVLFAVLARREQLLSDLLAAQGLFSLEIFFQAIILLQALIVFLRNHLRAIRNDLFLEVVDILEVLGDMLHQTLPDGVHHPFLLDVLFSLLERWQYVLLDLVGHQWRLVALVKAEVLQLRCKLRGHYFTGAGDKDRLVVVDLV